MAPLGQRITASGSALLLVLATLTAAAAPAATASGPR